MRQYIFNVWQKVKKLILNLIKEKIFAWKIKEKYIKSLYIVDN